MDRLRELAAKTHTLLSIQLNVTQRCNLFCRHCYRAPEQVAPCPDPTTRELVDIMEQAHELGALFVAFSGGEPLLRPDWVELFQEARRLKMGTTLMTNGTLLDEKAIQKLVDLNPGRVQISLYGAKASTHDWVTRTPGSYSKALAVVESLAAHGLKVSVVGVVMRQNAKEIKVFFEWGQSIGADVGVNLRMMPRLDGQVDETDLFVLQSQLKPLFEIPDLKSGIRVGTQDTDEIWKNLSYCTAGASSLCVNSDLTVWPCTSLPVELGRLDKEQTLEEIWKDSLFLKEFQALRRGKDLQECRTCEYRLSCSRCPGAAMLAGHTIHGREPEFCKVAKVLHELKEEHKKQQGLSEERRSTPRFAAAGDHRKTH